MRSTKCVACGFVGFSDETCKACGAPLNQPATTNVPPVAPTPVHGSQYGHWDQPAAEGEKKGMAIVALVLGIVSLFSFGIIGIGAVTGIVLACTAMGRVKREPWKYGGRGMAIAGLAMCITSLVMIVPLGMVAAIAIPNIFASYRAANEGSAIHSVQAIAEAEATYQSTFRKFGTFEELVAADLIDPRLSSGEKNGYRFSVTVPSADSFEVNAVPITYRTTGMRSFYIDETAVIRCGDNFGGPSSKMDEPLESYYESQRSRRDRRVDSRNSRPY